MVTLSADGSGRRKAQNARAPTERAGAYGTQSNGHRIPARRWVQLAQLRHRRRRLVRARFLGPRPERFASKDCGVWPTAARDPAYYLRDECEDGGEERQDIAGEHQPGFHVCSLALD
ncbi:hypothetical protein GCM10010441_02570 [Kitasatospora paracochleata]